MRIENLPEDVTTKLQGLSFQRMISITHCLTTSPASLKARALHYNDFLAYVCSQWGLKCSPDELALIYHWSDSTCDPSDSDGKRTPTLITSPIEWTTFWNKWNHDERRRDQAHRSLESTRRQERAHGSIESTRRQDKLVPFVEIVPRPSIPEVFLAGSGGGQRINTPQALHKAEQQMMPPAREAAAVAQKASAQAAAPESTSPASIPETRTQAAPAETPGASQHATSSPAQTSDAGSFWQKLARDLTHAHDSFVKATEAFTDVIDAAQYAATPVSRGGAGMYSSGEAAAHQFVDLFHGLLESMRSASLNSAQESTTPRDRTQRPTPSSSYDNAPPSQPLRETPVPEDRGAAARNHAAVQAAQDPVRAPASPAVQNTQLDKGKGRELPDKAGDSPARITPSSSSSPSASEDWEQLRKPAESESLKKADVDENANSKDAIAANNVALEDAFNAMLQRLRQE